MQLRNMIEKMNNSLFKLIIYSDNLLFVQLYLISENYCLNQF